MNEIKQPKKPLIFYYGIVLLILVLFNFLAMPWLLQRQIQQVDYGTFMTMTDNGEIGQVEIQEQENQILFTNKDNTQVYKTGMVEDPDLAQRLWESGAKFSGEIVEQMSPILNFLLSWLLPILIFVGIGQLLSKRLMKRAGGANSMAFGMGKSNAKVYVKSSEGIKFSDVAGEDEAKENLAEIVDYLHNPQKYKEVGAAMPKGLLLVALPAPAKPCWPRLWPARLTFLSSPCPAQSLWRCSWAWAPPKSGIYLSRQKRKLPALYSSTRLTPSGKSVTASWGEMMSGNRP